MNRLIHEKSPYLQQHAHNPVDWYPWGDEAFERARKEGKLIFLSIGYSTCHWCHVMERESFEDKGIARLLNESFVAIKVDREERPDVDELYMEAVTAVSGQGGWPLSVFLTPEGRPFWGGTYFPPEDGYGRPGFRRVLLTLSEIWSDRPDEIEGSASRITDLLGSSGSGLRFGEGDLSGKSMESAYRQLAAAYDPVHGGFGGAPKFPQGHILIFLLRYGRRTGNDEATRMATETMRHMARGGIYDHLGGGFHRYSTDEKWLVPHFEKMLYDQAVLALAYLEAYQATREGLFRRTADGVLDYVLRDMMDPRGGFHSAEDADSEGEEGIFYVWKLDELIRNLGEEGADFIIDYFGATSGGNFEGGANILHAARDVSEVAREHGLDAEQATAFLHEACRRLLARRTERARPLKDDKILTSWNGLMISAMARGGIVLERRDCTRAAEAAADFVLEHLVVDQRLMRRHRQGETAVKGFIEDYAFMAEGLLDLYAASFDPRRLQQARGLLTRADSLFLDTSSGSYFLTGHDGEELIARRRAGSDGAIPGGTGMMARAWLRLGALTGDGGAWRTGERSLSAALGETGGHPMAGATALTALDFYLGPRRQIVISSGRKAGEADDLLAVVRRRYAPRDVVLRYLDGEMGEALEGLAPFVRGRGAINGCPTAYVCENFTCRLPVNSVVELERLLER